MGTIGKDQRMGKKEYYVYDSSTGEIEQTKGLAKFLSKLDKWKVAKQAISMAASGCATVVVSRYLKANMPEAENIFDKAVMGVGMYFITGIVGAKVADYCESELDSWRDSVMLSDIDTTKGECR
jgi:hypothetical protein